MFDNYISICNYPAVLLVYKFDEYRGLECLVWELSTIISY